MEELSADVADSSWVCILEIVEEYGRCACARHGSRRLLVVPGLGIPGSVLHPTTGDRFPATHDITRKSLLPSSPPAGTNEPPY